MPPDLFVDRSLGRIAVPGYLRTAWPATVRTLDEVFGKGKVEDTRWMRLADKEGWIAACRDDRTRFRPGEGKVAEKHPRPVPSRLAGALALRRSRIVPLSLGT